MHDTLYACFQENDNLVTVEFPPESYVLMGRYERFVAYRNKQDTARLLIKQRDNGMGIPNNTSPLAIPETTLHFWDRAANDFIAVTFKNDQVEPVEARKTDANHKEQLSWDATGGQGVYIGKTSNVPEADIVRMEAMLREARWDPEESCLDKEGMSRALQWLHDSAHIRGERIVDAGRPATSAGPVGHVVLEQTDMSS